MFIHNLRHLDQLQKSTYLQIEDNVYLFTNEFDELIHEELKRSKRVIDHSLSSCFNLDDGQGLEDVLFYNVLNQNKEVSDEDIEKIASYLKQSVNNENYYDFVNRIINNQL